MLAFWADIDIRREKGLRSSRPFPIHKLLVKIFFEEYKYSLSSDDGCNNDLAEVTPIPVPCVYETLDGKPWSKSVRFRYGQSSVLEIVSQ
jgi:hypothetical protein